jgi:cytochrome c-type biogenesis protein CcmF
MTTLGNLLLWATLIAAAASVVLLFVGRSRGKTEGEGATNTAYLLTFGVLGTLTVSVAILLAAFFREDFAFQYVAENHSTDVSNLLWLYKISGVWAGREGSLLFWAWLVAIFGAYIAWRRMSKTDELSNMSLAVFNVVQVFFAFALIVPLNNPFKVTPAQWLGPNGELLVALGMNPLLQHWAMILHPPTLFVGYAGLVAPFAFAIGALIVGDGSKTWVTIVDRITVFAWLFLGIGIGLGAIWAYVVLGWGGYWAWDPVENASLLPWLTGVGLLHSFTAYRRRGAFKKWAVVMATATFVFVILGTFITRSGVVQSVHAFQRDMWSLGIFLAMMVTAAVAAAVGLYVRNKEFSGADEFESLTSKEASYYFNNVIMLLAAILVAAITLAPTFGLPTYGPDTYDAIAHPVGILYVAVMAVCPLLSWRKTEGPLFWSKIKWPLLSAAIVSVPLLWIWYNNLNPVLQANGPMAATQTPTLVTIYAISGLIVGALAVTVSTYLFIEGARRRSQAKDESFGSALWKNITQVRTASGGYLTHLGIGIILIGLVGSAMFVNEVLTTVADEPGAQFQVDEYTFTYNGFDEQQLANGDLVFATEFAVSRNGTPVGEVAPGQIQFAQQQQTKLNAAVLVEPLQDVFVVFQGSQDGLLSMQVKINPLISWVWVGFVFTIIGTALASWPRKQPQAA